MDELQQQLQEITEQIEELKTERARLNTELFDFYPYRHFKNGVLPHQVENWNYVNSSLIELNLIKHEIEFKIKTGGHDGNTGRN
ncbi:hypothetical protein [Butyrivibrio virus Bo-Finn]|nr:hypothetical protein [Butyrivibrio virus Bo-Finn]